MPTLEISVKMPALPAKVYLRRKEVEAVVGGWRQLAALEAAGRVQRVILPGYTRAHYPRAQVQAVLVALYGH
jgi:hypothetical protein